ncbi:epoxide hydrolase [Leifsonia sp. F6_8S_P_1B]|uniref:Epoxide hydrolase n=1 Tax=Leifsonia williamsii TaxID=3035919 RepID=A0ABT8KCX8_9MICO|nr:epoxide hydrolase family protein [Leifsonia williamsii]MDN4615318.1 epoxide hydrolase [Leifsonia williamsii]
MTPTPFRLHVPDAVLTELRERLEHTRYVQSIGGARGPSPARPAGLGGDRLRALVDRWLAFDWRGEEARLAGYEQYTAEVRGHRLHFVRVRPERPAAVTVPLLLLHGWPSAFTEYLPLADALAERATDDLAFDIVVPSLPGFVFSELPAEPLTRRAIGEDLHALMTVALGFERYAAFGGDIGGGAATWLGALHPEAIIGLQLIHPPFPDDEPQSDEERVFLEALEAYDESDSGYSEIMGTRPDTIAAALADSPAGLLAWIADKWDDWADGGLAAVDEAELFRVATLYWVTGTIGTSFQQYFDWPLNERRPPITAPVGVLLSKEPFLRDYPRSLVERAVADLRSFEVPETGGHFLGAEQPAATAEAIRRFFGAL